MEAKDDDGGGIEGQGKARVKVEIHVYDKIPNCSAVLHFECNPILIGKSSVIYTWWFARMHSLLGKSPGHLWGVNKALPCSSDNLPVAHS